MVFGLLVFTTLVFLWLAIGSDGAMQVQNRLTANNPKRQQWLMAGLLGIIYVLIMLSVNRLWYQQQARTDWHFFNDNAEWLQMDKVGHFYATFHTARIIMHALKNRGLALGQATNIGSLCSFLMLTPIEFFDGYAAQYGASLGDAFANASGAMFFWWQLRIYKRVVCMPKYSFHPTQYAAMRPNVLGNGIWQSFLKDYNGQTYWFNIPANRLLPTAYRFAPAWLNVAVGYSADGMAYGRTEQNLANGLQPAREYLFSLNISLRNTSLFRKYGHTTTVRAIVFWFEGYQLPFPCIQLGQNGFIFHPLYF